MSGHLLALSHFRHTLVGCGIVAQPLPRCLEILLQKSTPNNWHNPTSQPVDALLSSEPYVCHKRQMKLDAIFRPH